MAKVIINRVKFSNKIKGALTQKRFSGIAGNAAQARFDYRKDELLNDFDSHSVTKELLAGPSSDSIFLDRGNLISFLGLENGERSIAELRNKLQISIKMNKTPEFKKTSSGVNYEFKVKSPTLQEIYDSAPSPWSNKSFIEQIQDGVSNFIYFIYDKLGGFSQYSRSGTGLQSKYKRKNDRTSRVLGIPYINEILNKFKFSFLKK
jgi:hypothetical protein